MVEKTEDPIVTKLIEELDDWDIAYHDINPSFAPKEKDILELIDMYWMSKFREGDDYGSQWQKLFYNIVENPSLVAAKQIDFDTKDIKINAEPGHSQFIAYLLQRELDLWMKESNFGELINKTIFDLPKYGHIYLKKRQGTLEHVAARMMRVNQSVESIEHNIHTEMHPYSAEEFVFWGTTLHWENVSAVLDRDPDEDGKYRVYERTDPIKKTYTIIFLNDKKQSEVLFHAEGVKSNYREHKWENIPGRHLGRGTVEKLFTNQIARNESENFFRQGLKWTSLKVFQTRDQSISKNLLYEIENGDVIKILNEITQIGMDERNLSSYQYADSKWDSNSQERTFSFDPIQGKGQASGVRLGQTVIQAKMAGTYYDLMQENLGMFFSNIIENDILPEFKRQKVDKHLFNLLNLGDDIQGEKIKRNVITENVNAKIGADFILKGRFPSPETRNAYEMAEKMLVSDRKMPIPKSFYENLKYKVKVIITGEQIDIAAKLNVATTILQILGSNPAVFQDKKTAKVMMKIMEWSGVNPEEFDFNLDELDPGPRDELLAQRGGSIARPATPSSAPTSVKTAQTV